MTQDQYGQTRGPGYVVRGDAVPDDENEEFADGQPKPMTRFQKVASALRGGAERDEQDQAAADQVTEAQVAADPAARDEMGPDQAARAADPQAQRAGPPWVTQQDEAAMANSPISQESRRQGDYWDEPASAADRDGAVAVTNPDVPVAETDDVPADDVPAGEVTGTTGRHAAGTPVGASASTESRPGEAAGALGDFSDLTYGNLLPDATVYIEQWQQVQFKFVDDPHASVTEAADIIAQVTAKMEAAIQERQRAIEERQRAIAEQQRSLRGRWGEGTNADTEALRETLRMYKTFLDQLVGLRVS